MKKNILLTISALVLISSNIALAEDFDSLENITPVQKQKLSQIHFKYKQDYNSLEQRIIEYNSKMAVLQKDTEKSPAEIAMLKAAYERNLKTLKAQQAQLETDTDTLYKNVLTEEQYAQYKSQKQQTEDAFNNFLQK